MLGENKNLKDPERKSLMTSYGAGTQIATLLSYTKTNKLVTALYMVTDTMEKEEPIRLRLRTLGIEILSDIPYLQKENVNNFDRKITAVLSFLNIARDLGMISEMNFNILNKEFQELKQSIQELTTKNDLWLEEFIGGPVEREGRLFTEVKGRPYSSTMSFSKGHGMRIGVQKGSTLLSALNKVKGAHNLSSSVSGNSRSGFEVLKNNRRESILKVIKMKPESASIKDIISAFRNVGEEIGEKTLQRELISMVKDNVLKKTGEKRWSHYSLI